MKQQLTLDQLTNGAEAKIDKISRASRSCRQKLLAMGLTPGVRIRKERVAPLGDPIQFVLRGFHLSLRQKEAQQITITVDDDGTKRST